MKADSAITKPGIYSITLERYHSGKACDGPSISSSGLRKIFLESPAHYWDASPYNKDRQEPKEKKVFVLGRAAHHLLLGEDDFSTLYTCRPPKFKDWRTDAAKDWRTEQEAEGRTVLVPAQLDQIRGMARSLAGRSGE